MIKAGVGEGWGEPPQRASLAPARLPSGVTSRVRAMPAGWVEEGVPPWARLEGEALGPSYLAFESLHLEAAWPWLGPSVPSVKWVFSSVSLMGSL